jgi:2,3-dihydroxybenzoate decarboxylase
MSTPVPFSKDYRRIATEEAWSPPEMLKMYRELLASGKHDDPGFESLWGFYAGSKSERPASIFERLQDMDARRIADMDATGIDVQILLLTSPGVQVFDAATAKSLSVLANDQLADAVRRHPTRYVGLAACAPQDPAHAAKEIERGVRQLGLRGVIINSHTRHEYLNDPKFWAIFEAAEALDVPVYLHPNTPSKGLIQPLVERGLDGAIYGFGVETGMHALTIITSGVFDRFPKLKLVLGHLGEALPFWMFRLDYMHRAGLRANRYACMKPLKQQVSDYLKQNVYVTTSGMPWAPAIRFCQQVLGDEHVLYAMDYPYQYVAEEVLASDAVPMSAEQRRRFFQTNAEELFGFTAAGLKTGATRA